MVALECELPVTGRLSPPTADDPMSVPCYSTVSSSDRQQDCSQGFPAHNDSGLFLSRSACKRKLSHEGNDVSSVGSCCYAEKEERLYSSTRRQHDAVESAGVTCGRCGENCSGEPDSKKRRLSCAEDEDSSEAESIAVVHDVVDNSTEHSQEVLVEEANITLSVEQTLDVITTPDSYDVVSEASTEVAAVEVAQATPFSLVLGSAGSFLTQDSLDSVTEDSLDSVVEVDVIGDDDTAEDYSSSQEYISSSGGEMMFEQQSDSGFCGDEASSEDGDDDDAMSDVCQRPSRISPFLNTPKQRKEERRKVLKLSIQKMRAVEDPEHFLRRSVLINNTMKRLQRELREEKQRNGPRRGCYGLYRRSSAFHYDVLNNSYLLHDEPFAVSENDRITDDMTDALVTRLEATSSNVVPTPSPSPGPTVEADSSFMEFPSSSSPEDSCSSDVSSSVSEPTSSTLHDDQPSSFSEPCSSSSEDLVQPVSESMDTGGSEAMSSTVSVLTSPISSSSVSSSHSAVYEDSAFPVSNVVREPQSPNSSCSSQSQREKQLYADIDVVFNNLIHALGDS